MRKSGSANSRILPMKGKNDGQKATPKKDIPAIPALTGSKIKK